VFQIHFHKGNNESIYEYLPKECLPRDFGGELPTVAELDGIFSSVITSTKLFFSNAYISFLSMAIVVLILSILNLHIKKMATLHEPHIFMGKIKSTDQNSEKSHIIITTTTTTTTTIIIHSNTTCLHFVGYFVLNVFRPSWDSFKAILILHMRKM
jgi:Na+-transporting methylmalonyl-CoA/oxaloacetate decarboxylase gamma subunit